MYKLLIVEDEKWEREGLLDFLNWEEMGIEVVGCACNGVEGERIAKALRPQIIITDIRMPVLDGIQMSNNIRSFLPDTKIIMLTGYDDFEYAKQTFSFQAFAYLLKPVQKKEIVDIIVNVLEKLEDEKNHQKKKTELESQYVDYYQKNCDHMLVDYLSNKFELKAIQSLQPLIKLKAPGKKVVAIIYFCLNSAISNKKQDFQNVFLNTMKSFNHMLGETGIAASCGELPEEAVLCMQAPSTRRELENILLNIMQEFRAKTGVQCIAGIGAVVDGLELTPRSYAQAREAIGFRFLASYGELIFYSSISYTECR
ncbi:MAG TPA: response regulator, partial [Thermoclostridium sp.]|nr:response regulator [Thermoclostridium sp.]